MVLIVPASWVDWVEVGAGGVGGQCAETEGDPPVGGGGGDSSPAGAV